MTDPLSEIWRLWEDVWQRSLRAALDASYGITRTIDTFKPEPHAYLSTGCLHGRHDYCQNKAGQAGPKRPAECKFCQAKCICDCHREEGHGSQ